MRNAAIGLALLALAAGPGRAGEVPDPLFWVSEEAFLEEVGAGQLVDRLELHLLQFAADPGWRAEWAARRYSGNGLFGEWGSTTGRDLYLNAGIALNLFPLERLQFRYDRREYRDGRFEVSDQRFDVLWYARPGWAVGLTGWPTFDKEHSSLGLGLRIGAPGSRNALELRVVSEKFVWNEKADGDVRFTRRPLRLLADGVLEKGAWRLHATVDLGLAYEAEEAAAGEPEPARSTRGFRRWADLSAERSLGRWAAGVRFTGAAFERSQREGTGESLSLDRRWGRLVLTLRRDLGRFTAHGLVGFAGQRDDFSSPSVADGSYRSDAALFGLEGASRPLRGLEVRLGYLGSSQRCERAAGGSPALPDADESPYLDKAHVRALYELRPGMTIELLLSQALRGGSFGGGSMKALLVF